MSRETAMMHLAVEARCSSRTVRRYLDGNNVIPLIESAIKDAAKKLNIALEPLRKKVR